MRRMAVFCFPALAGILAVPIAVANHDIDQRPGPPPHSCRMGMDMQQGEHRMSGMQMGGMRMAGMPILGEFRALPAEIDSESNPITPAKVELGRLLYFERRLSASGQLSCNSCHDLASYGVDHQPTSLGHKNQRGTRNSPTVYNAAGHFAQFWDGRAATIEDQAKGPILNPVEMAMPSEKAAVAAIRAVPEYVARFEAAFPGETDPVTFDNIANAIGAFERKLVTPSRWDRFLEGDGNALTAEERAGFQWFMHSGCASCHSGTFVGGNSYQRLGEAVPYPERSDLGRFQVTRQASDRMVFKVPSLRNVEMTAPYFHNGKVATLEEAVTRMARYQLGVELLPDEKRVIVAWLKTLTGELPAEYISEPKALPGD
ncbi:MAG: cytochrome-c peroxidase [Acidobacteriia bacterium]|nr:cytochrome-c peroxidase [Terriglobia bacterium]